MVQRGVFFLHSNKKIAANIISILAVFSFFFFTFSSAQGVSELYVLGEKIVLDLGRVQKYELSLSSPVGTKTLYGRAREVIVVPDELGLHQVRLRSGSWKKTYEFTVVSSIPDPVEVGEADEIDSVVDGFVSDEIGTMLIPHKRARIRVGEPVKWRLTTSQRQLNISNYTNISARTVSGDSVVLAENSDGLLQIADSSNEVVVVDFQTPAPVQFESVISDNFKVVTVSSSHHYTDVRTSTSVAELVPVGREESFSLLWREENRFLPFTALDENNNGLVDTLYWNVPHLSNQSFQIIIKIVGAEHLDSDRSFIKDIYDLVKERDGNWTNISDGEFVRVTFEENLSSENDITLYAKSSSNESAEVEVYEKDSSTLLATFTDILAESFYKIFLTNLTGSQDTFDLKVLGGILIDYIVDPVGYEPTLAQIFQTNVLQNAATEISADFNNETVVGSNYSHTVNTNLQFQEAGWYKVSYGCIIQEVPVGGGARTEMTGWLDLDGVEVVPSRSYTYLRDSEDSRDRGSLSAVTLVNASVSSNLTLQLVDLFGAEQPDPEESCWISAERLYRPAILVRETTNYDHNINETTHFTQDLAEIVYSDNDTFTADLTNNRIAVDEDGWYKIYYVANSEQTAGTSDNDRITPASYLYKNSTAELEPSMTYSYHKRSDQAAFSGEEGYTIAFLNAGENISLRRFALERQQATAITGTLNDTWILMEKFPDDNVLLIWDTTGGQGITGSTDTESAPANITWDSQVQVGSNYSHVAGQANFTIDETGWFEVSYAVSFDGSTGSNRKISCAQLVRDGVVVEPSKLCEYLRDSTVEDNSVGASFLINNTAGSWYTLQHTVTPQSNGGGHTLIADSSWIAVNPVNEPDRIPPAVTITAPLDGQVFGALPIFFNVTTNEPATAWYSLNGGGLNVTMDANATNTGFNDTNNSLADGTYTFQVYANDTSGNNNFTESISFTLDTTAPQVTIHLPENITYNTTSLNLNFSFLELNPDSCWYSNDSGVTNYSLPSCANISYTAVQSSTQIFVYANDTAGNENKTNVTFFVDSVNPLIVFSADAYASGTVLSETWIYTNVTVTELNEANITFNLHNATGHNIRSNTFTDATRSVNWTLLAEGFYEYNVTVVDIINNENSTQTRNITLDTTDPLINYVAPTQDNEEIKSQNWIFVNTSVTETNEANITFTLYNLTSLVNQTTYLAGNRTINWTSLPDTKYTYNVTVTDLASQAGSTASRNLTLDTTNPLVDFGLNTESNFTNFTRDWVFVNITVTELHESNVTFSLFNPSGVENETTYLAGNRTINWTGLSDNVYRYNVTVRDDANNQNFTVTRWIGLDNTGPTINLIRPEAKTYGFNTSLPLNHTVTDNIVGVDSCWWNIDEGANQSITCGTNTTFNTSDGEHTIYFYSNDTFNNLGQAQVTFSVSTAGPAITLNDPANDTFYPISPTEVFFNYTPTDPDGVPSCSLYGSWNGGWHLNQTDFTIFNETPNNFTVNITGEGSYVWNVECNDTLAQYDFSLNNFTVGIDLTDPQMLFAAPTEVNNSNRSSDQITVNVTVNETNEKNITFELFNATHDRIENNTFTNGTRTVTWFSLDEGRYYYNVTIFDKASRMNITETRTILLDVTGPSATLLTPVNDTYQKNATQNFSASVSDDNELANATLYIFNSTGQLIYETTRSLVGLTAAVFGELYTFTYDGVFKWFYRVRDFVGNTFDTENNTVIIDTAISQISFVSPTEANNTAFIRNWIFANVTINESNFKNVTFNLLKGGSPHFANTFTDSTRSINWTLLADDTYQYFVRTFDLANNSNVTDTRWLILDNVFPQIDYGLNTEDHEANKSQNWIFANVSITEVNEANVTFTLYNQTSLVNQTVLGPGSRTINWTNLPDAKYTYNVTITDRVNQQNSTASRNITLDTTVPQISFVAPTLANDSYAERDWIVANVSVSEAYEANVTFTLYNQTSLVNQTTLPAGTYSINWTSLPNANVTYRYNVTARDRSLNENSTDTRWLLLADLTGPVITIVNPKEQNYTINESIPLDYVVSDVNLDSCWYNLDGGANTTLTNCQNSTLSVADEQTYNLTLFSNDTLGQLSKQYRLFSVNTSLIIVKKWKVERGTASADGTSFVTLQSSFATSKSFILHTQRSTDSGPDSLFVQSDFVNDTAIQFDNYATGGGAAIEYEVITGPDLTVTRNVETFGTGDSTLFFSVGRSFNLSSSFLIVSTRLNSGTNSDNQRGRWAARFVNSTFIEVSRGVSGTAGELSWQAVEWDGAVVQNGSFSQSELSGTNTLASSLNLTTSFLIFSSTSNSGTSLDFNHIGGFIPNQTHVHFYRQDDDAGTMDAEWFVVSTPAIRVQRDSIAVTSATVSDSMAEIQNASKAFFRGAWDSTGSGTTFANGILTGNVSSTTAVTFDPGTTGGNVKNVSWHVIEIESNEPTITVNDPLNQNYSTASVDFNVTLNEQGSCEYTITNGNTNISMGTTDKVTFNATNASIPDGQYTAIFYCLDEASNLGSATRDFGVDTVAPQVAIHLPENITYNTTSLTINYSVDEINLDSCWYSNDSGVTNYSLPSCANISYTAVQSSTQIFVYANDTAGNQNKTNITFFVDSVNPLIVFSANAHPSGSVVAGTWVYTNVTVTELNEANITFNLYNATGHNIRSNTFTDGTRSVNWTLLAEGLYEYNVTVVDIINNENSTETRNITVDDTNPVVNYIVPTESNEEVKRQNWVFVNTSVTEVNEANITFTLFNQTSLVNETTYAAGSRTINWTSLPDAKYTYNVTVADLAGHTGSTASRNLTLDTTNPLVDFGLNTESNFTNFTRDWVFVNITVTELHESNVTFSLFNPSGVENETTYLAGNRTINWTGLSDNVYRYNVTVRDDANNQNFTVTRWIGLDNTGPTINLIRPEAKTYGFNTSLPLNHTVTDNIVGVDSCWWNIDEGANQSITCGTNTTFNTSDGEHTIYFYSNDTFNNLGQAQVTFSVSTAGPAIDLHDPVNDTFYPTTPTEVFFNYTPTDPDGVMSCSLYGSWNGGWHLNQTDFTIFNETPNNFTVNITGEGTYVWNVECNDSLAQYEFSLNNFTVGIDLTDPQMLFAAPTEVNNSNRSSDQITVNVTVNETNEKNITFELFNSSHDRIRNNTFTNKTRTVTWFSLDEGRYYYNVTIFDKASRMNITETRTILLDVTGPSATLLTPGNDTYQKNATQNFSASVSDDNELANATLYIFNSTGQLIYNTTRSLVGLTAAVFGELYTFAYDGVFKWFYRVRDFVGNTFDTENNTVIIDTTIPQIVFVSPTENNDTAFTRNWIFANVTINESNFKNVTFSLLKDGSPHLSNTFTDSTRSINWTLLADDTYQYFVRTFDLANNSNVTETRWLILDNVFPQIEYGTNTEDNEANKSQNWVFVNVSITEANEANVTFTLYNQTALVNQTTLPGGTRTINWTSLPDTKYTYNVTITDRVNQQNSTASRNITLDTTVPQISFVAPTLANDSFVERDWIFVNVSVSESAEANVTFTLADATGAIINQTTLGPGNRTINWTNLASSNVTYRYNVTARDHSLNENTTDTRWVLLADLTAPTLVFFAPQHQNYTNNESVPLQFFVSDKNLDRCWYNLDGGANTTVASCANTTFATADEQTFNLSFFVNDSLNQVSKYYVVFDVNTSLVIVNFWNVERGTVSVDGTQNEGLTDVFYPSRSFILHEQRSADSGPDSLFVQNNFVDENTVQFENYAAGGGAVVEYEVVTGPPIRVQRNIEAFGTTDTSINVTLAPAINLSDSFILVSTRLNSGTDTGNQRARWRGRFVNNTTIQLQRGVSGDAGEISWQVVSWEGAVVQNGSFSQSTVFGRQALDTAVNPNNSILFFSSTTDSGTTLQLTHVGGYLNATDVSFYRVADDTGFMYNDWFVVTDETIDARRGSFDITGATSPENNQFAPAVINQSRTFIRNSWDSTGGGNTHANAVLTSNITNTTNLYSVTGTTGTNNKNVSWQVFEIIELEPPVINLLYPQDTFNQSGYTLSQFNYSFEDKSGIVNCTLQGNWTGVWHINQTVSSPAKAVENNYSAINTTGDGFYRWNVECTDVYLNTGSNATNFTFSTYLPPHEPTLFNASQDANDGTGNVTLFWNATTHARTYNVYYAPNLSTSFTFLNKTSVPNFTDTSFSGSKRRFYMVEAVNPIGSNNTTSFFGAHRYTLNHNSNTRNWLGFPTNFTYLTNANDTLQEITNATAVTLWNATIQQRVTCNDFSCPNEPACTSTACNFGLESGRGYEVNINSSAPSQINWSGVGVVYDAGTINLTKNTSSFGKNWIVPYANTTLLTAQTLFEGIFGADAVSKWNDSLQTSQGLIFVPQWNLYIGTNFNIEIERGYEVSVNQSGQWNRT